MIVFLTGASGGIGREITRQLLAEGHVVIAQVGENPKALDSHQNLYVFSADISNFEEREKLFQKTIETVGYPDVLINNAGINSNGMSWKIAMTDWSRVMAVNLDAAFHFSQMCIPNMRKSLAGRIIYISSVVALQGMPGTAPYAASKAALLGLMRTQALELADRNITVNAIAPGYLDAGMIHQVPADIQTQIISKIPKGALGKTHQIVGLIKYLISADAEYVTGQTLHFNGGLLVT
ncbi:MAG: SDR family oxidoreductase [Cryomorphaceae bacterium]|nr:SDR family oxidoreductase [Cryomorphaceae bacterium]